MLSPFLTNENKCPGVYFTTDFAKHQCAWVNLGPFSKCGPYILAWMYETLLCLVYDNLYNIHFFSMCAHPGCSWIDHIFTYQVSHWYWVKQGSPLLARRSFLRSTLHLAFLKDKVYYGMIWGVPQYILHMFICICQVDTRSYIYFLIE